MKKVRLLEFVTEEKISKAGKPYKVATAMFEGEIAPRTGFVDREMAGWQEGMEVLAVLFDEEYNGKIYKKFKVAGELEFLKAEVASLADRVNKLEGGTTPAQKENPKDDLVEEPVDDDGLPF